MHSTHRLKASDYHRTPIRLLNAAWGILNTVGLARISLDSDSLIARAKKDTGLTDFGGDDFLEPMHLLIHSLETEADLNPVGRFMNRTNILRLLKGRLQAQALFTQHPDIKERELLDPVVIVGLARSGTTRLHRLLAADQRFSHVESWESVYPVPDQECFAAQAKVNPDPRINALDQGLKAVLYMSPQINAVHPLGTREVEEEIGLIQYGFSTQLFEVQARIPSFAEWLMTHDQTAAYSYMSDLLKLVSWFRNDPTDKPWLLKSPQHMQDLDALLNVFPNAKLLCPHRDPVKVVGSSCSMAWNALVRDSNSITPHWVGQEWLTKTERMLRKNLSVRDTVASENQYDVMYADISANWQKAMQKIYDFLGIPLTDTACSAMQNWLDINRQHKHGAHKYSLAEFGLTDEIVENKLKFYRDRFHIPVETRNPNLTATN